MSDLISRQSALDALDKETVSTNPEKYLAKEKFIPFMDDAEVSSFGKWQWANGFNTALVTARVALKKLPSATVHPHDVRLLPITNADRIRAMTDEELADWLGVYCNGQTAQEVGKPCVSDMGSCEECWLDWLKRESEYE